MPKITPFLWLDADLEEVARFYSSVFKHAKVVSVSKMSATLELEGQRLHLLSGGPHKFNESVSFFIDCETQDEVDYYWRALLEGGGSESKCGWLKDRYGLSWQVVPGVLGRYLNDKDPARVQRVVQAMLQMQKLDIATLDRAHAG